MKKAIILIVCLLPLFTGCKESKEQSVATTIEATPKPVVYTSNYPLFFFASKIAGDAIDLHFPAKNMTDPSGWDSITDTIAKMQTADLILVNGAAFERWLMQVSLPENKIVDTSAGFNEQFLPSGSTFTHSHGNEGEHEHEGTAFTTWMNLELATRQAEAVKNALLTLLPDKKEMLETNYKDLSDSLMELHTGFKQVVPAESSTSVTFSHPVYQYFSKAYGIKGSSVHWEPDTPLDHDKLHEVEHIVGDAKIRFMIWEGEPLEESVRKLENMGIKSVVISPVGGQPQTGDFLSEMQKNLKALKTVYAGAVEE